MRKKIKILETTDIFPPNYKSKMGNYRITVASRNSIVGIKHLMTELYYDGYRYKFQG